MIHTDGEPTIAMRESDPKQDKPDKTAFNFKQYADLGNDFSYFLLMEVKCPEGDPTNALDLRTLIEKLEYPGLGMSAVVPLNKML